jgi:hypothetical protein
MDDCECEVLSVEMDLVGADRGAYVGPAARRRERGSLEVKVWAVGCPFTSVSPVPFFLKISVYVP